jgi:hypothetical protein
MKQTIILLLGLALLPLTACRKNSTTASSSPNTQEPSKMIEVCSLLKKEEVEELQGSPVTDTKSSERAHDGVIASQCFYNAKEFSRSINLVLNHVDPRSQGGHSPRDVWKEMFGRFSEDEEEREEAEKKAKVRGGEESESTAPTRIAGLGEQAFWVGSRVGGALYVLKNNAFIFLSIGGADSQEVKIDKTKKLAAKVLERM